jgi:Mg2+ and Co2+ transporter CorA
MGINEVTNEIARIRKLIEDQNTASNRLEGRKEELMKTLLGKFKLKTIGDAERHLKSLVKEREKLGIRLELIYLETKSMVEEVNTMEKDE